MAGWGISRKHALAIVNRGNATAADIIALKNEIQPRRTGTLGSSTGTGAGVCGILKRLLVAGCGRLAPAQALPGDLEVRHTVVSKWRGRPGPGCEGNSQMLRR